MIHRRQNPIRLRALAGFYASFLPVSLVVNICGFLILRHNGLELLLGVVYLKLFTSLVVIYVTNERFKARYFYFFNLGLSKRRLWGTSLAVDYFIYITTLWIAV